MPVPTSNPAGRAYWARLLPVLAALAVITRVPSFLQPYWNPDEGFLATQARMLAAGGRLYETVVDRKPPLLPWLYEGAFAVFGDQSLWPLRVLAVLAQLATAVLLGSLARRRWGDVPGRTAAVLYLLVSIGLNPEDTQAATFEVFMLPWTVAAVWCADRRRWAAAGLCVAAATLTKQTGGAVLVPVLALLWYAPRRARGAAWVAVGFLVPPLAAALATSPARFLFWTVTGSGSYLTMDGSVVLSALGRAAGNAGLLAAACVGVLLPLVARRPERSSSMDLWLWLASSALAIAVGFHFFGHYFLQAVPPLVLLGTGALARLPKAYTTRSLLLSGVSCLAFLAWGLAAQPAELRHNRDLVAAVRERTAPDDRVLIWGMHPEQYWLADRAPASRYLTAGLLTNYSGGRGDSRVGERYAVPGSWDDLLRELADSPPRLIVDDSRGKPYAPARTPTLRAILHERYERVGAVDGAVLYALRAR